MLAIREKQLGIETPSTAGSLNNLANLYESQGNYAQALPFYERAIAISEKTLGKEHSVTKLYQENSELMLKDMQKKEAE